MPASENKFKKNKTEIPNSAIKKLPSLNLNKILFFLALLIITFITHYSNRDKKYTAWDDRHFIVDNPCIRELSLENLQRSYQKNKSEAFFAFISWGIEYKYWGLNPQVMHFNNLTLHIFTVTCVFTLMLLLSKQYWTSIFSTVIFAIHPMHAEVVHWITGRIWLLCGLGYFLCLILYHLYTIYLYKKKYLLAFISYFFSLFFFGLVLLSNSIGLVLAPLLFLFDFFYNRKIKWFLFLEKIPYFLLAVISFLMIMKTRGAVGDEVLLTSVTYSFFERIFVSSYSFIFHLYKILIPSYLSAFYPLIGKPEGSLPVSFYFFPVFVFAYIFIAFYSLKYNKIIFLGLVFYAVNIFPVIRLIPVQSDYLMADRYTYISHFGLSYIIGWYLNLIVEKKINLKAFLRNSILISSGIVAVIFCYLSWMRSQVWDNDITLWSDVLKKYPNVITACNNRGLAYMNHGKYDLALKDFNKVIEINPNNLKTLNNRAVLYNQMGDYQKSMDDLNLILKYNPYYHEAYYNRGRFYGKSNLFADALKDFDKAIQIKTDYVDAYVNRGIVHSMMGNFHNSIEDFNKAIELKPDCGDAFYNRAITYFNMKNYKNAYQDAIMADKFGMKPEPAFIKEIIKNLEQ